MLHIIGIGRLGKTILNKAYQSGVNATFTGVLKSEHQINQDDLPINLIDFKLDYIINPAAVLNQICNNSTKVRVIVISGLGGRHGASLLESLTEYLLKNAIPHHSIGVCPFVFEGTLRRQKAIDTILKLQSNPSFTYFDNNLIIEKLNGKIKIDDAFKAVDGDIIKLIANLSTNHLPFSPTAS